MTLSNPITQNILLLTLCNLLFYMRTIYYKDVVDDQRRFTLDTPQPTNKKEKLIAYFKSFLNSAQYILDMQVERLANIVLHTITCILIYLAFGTTPQSLLAAYLFAFLPSNHQVTTWLNGKRYALSTIIVLLMWWGKPFTILLYPLSWYCQVNAFLSPVLYLVAGHYALIFYGVIAIAMPPFNSRIKRHIKEVNHRLGMNCNNESNIIRPQKLILLVKTFGYYASHSILPLKVVFAHTFMETYPISNDDIKYWYSLNWHFWKGLLLLTSTITLICLNWGTMLGFGLFWFTLFILQWCHFPYSITQAISVRYMYLANIGMMLALSSIVINYPIAATVFLTYYITKMWNFMPAYQNIHTLYEHDKRLCPEILAFRTYMTKIYFKKMRIPHAFVETLEGLRYRPKDMQFNFLMGVIMGQIGELKQADEYFQHSERNLIPGLEAQYTHLIAVERCKLVEIKREMDKRKGKK